MEIGSVVMGAIAYINILFQSVSGFKIKDCYVNKQYFGDLFYKIIYAIG